mmetsp:Transcript_876/g.2057  ORF Transcript_876/g.2057 Transcript_876/m.2057 type:complete len:226 (+) Transcript_876:1037-1714(+)
MPSLRRRRARGLQRRLLLIPFRCPRPTRISCFLLMPTLISPSLRGCSLVPMLSSVGLTTTLPSLLAKLLVSTMSKTMHSVLTTTMMSTLEVTMMVVDSPLPTETRTIKLETMSTTTLITLTKFVRSRRLILPTQLLPRKWMSVVSRRTCGLNSKRRLLSYLPKSSPRKTLPTTKMISTLTLHLVENLSVYPSKRQLRRWITPKVRTMLRFPSTSSVVCILPTRRD